MKEAEQINYIQENHFNEWLAERANETAERFDEKFGIFKFLMIDETGQEKSATPKDIKQFIKEEQEAIVKANLRQEIKDKLNSLN